MLALIAAQVAVKLDLARPRADPRDGDHRRPDGAGQPPGLPAGLRQHAVPRRAPGQPCACCSSTSITSSA
ncbi:MAG: hypothetical protein R3F43_29560 [bacterium]